MKVAAVSTLVSGVAAGSLGITWSDCGVSSTHGKTTDVQPSSLPLGASTAITGTGTVDKAVSGGTYDMELKAGGGLIDSHFTGNNCEAKSFDLPLGLGKLNWDGLSCPMAAGAASIGFHAQLAASLPPALATSDISLKAKDQDSEALLCVNLHLASQEEEVVLKAEQGSLGITWSDCGDSSTHGKTTDVQPSSLPLGASTAITGTGTVDKAVSGGTYDMELKAGGGLIDSHFTGNNCEAKSFDLPLGLGKLNWDGLSCPMAAGAASIGFHAQLAASLPPALATSDISLKAKDQDSEALLCVNLHLASQEEEVVPLVEAGSLGITWSDCGDSSTHGKTTDVQPSSLPLGASTAITGTGTVDKAVSGGTYDMELKAGGGLIDSHFTGNNCEAKSFDLPLGLGKLNWDGLSCPMAAGAASIGFHAQLAASLPPALATSDISLKAKDQDSESLLCVNLHLASQADMVV